MSLKPWVTITEQPAGKSQRFRYLSEVDGARSVGSIPGVSSTAERRTYPTISVHGHKGPFLVVLSLLNADNNLVHPHSITGSDPRYTCRNGVIFVISDEPEVVFKNIGILCVKGKTEQDVQSALKLRKLINVDPFGAGFTHIKDHRQIDFTKVRLCFQVFLPGPDWTSADRIDLLKYSRSLAPIASEVVYDAKKLNDLRIVHVTYCAGPLTGGTEMTLLCDKYTGHNPDVVFDDGHGWTQVATAKMHHKQLAIVFVAPPYREERDPRSPDYLKVKVYLRQNNDRGELASQSVPVEYLPNPPKGSFPLQFPKQPPSDYPACILGKGKGRGKSVAKKMDTCAMPGTSSPVTPFPPYDTIKMSPGSYQDFSPPVDGNLEADFSAYSGPGQQGNNTIPYNNTRGNNMILTCGTRMANDFNPTLPSTSGATNVTSGSYNFFAKIPSDTKIKRAVSERNRDKPDSGELLPKRKPMPLDLLDFGCDTSPAFINSNNPFVTSNGEIPKTIAQDHVNEYNPIFFQEIMSDPSLGVIMDGVANILYTEQTWHENIMASMTADHNNVNVNNFDQDNLGYNNIDLNNPGYNNVELNIPIDDNFNIAQHILPNINHILPHNIDNNLQINNGDRQHDIKQIDFEDVPDLSEDLKRGLYVSK